MKNTRYFKLFTVIIFTLLSISCSFWNNPQNNKNINDDKFILNGSINFDLSRAALPSIPSGEYYVSASDGNNEIAGSVENGIYSLTLERNKAWTVTAGLKSADSQTILMIDTWSIPQTNAEAVLSHTFVLKPLTSENGSGSLDLTIILNNDLDGIVSKVTADCKSANSDEWEVTITPYEELTFEADSPLEISVSDSQIASGQYEVSFNFYNANNILVYNTIQTINIFDNLTTDIWSSSGGTGPIKTDGTFELTKALVGGYSQTHLYVGATAFAATPSDTNANGSATKPFASVTGAVNYLKSVGSNQKDYTIYIVGTVDGAQEIKDDFTDDGSGNETVTTIPANSITLEGFNGLNNGIPQDILNGGFNDNDNGVTLTIQTNVPVTIKNLKITGGHSAEDFGSGLSVLSFFDEENSVYSITPEVYIEEGTLISENETDCPGAGIGIYGKATVTMNGGSIENNTSGYNQEGGFGGGAVMIYGVSSNDGIAKFILNNGTIKNNTANAYGAGVGMAYGGQFEMNGGIIGGNTDEDGNTVGGEDNSTFGGGVYVGSDCFFKMTGGSISHNKAIGKGTLPSGLTERGKCGGGGVCVQNGRFEMTGGDISNNTSDRFGGGVYLYSNSSFTMTAGTISGNTSTDEGKGVYLYSGSSVFQMGGSAIVQPDGSDVNDVYLPYNAKITIIENFDGDITCAALITPETYEENTSVIEAGGTNTLENEYKLFKLSSQTWKITATGQLDLAVKVGSLLLSDGTYISYDETRTAFTAEEFGDAKPVGVVYALNSNKTPAGIVGIKNDIYAWADVSSKGNTAPFEELRCSTSSTAPDSGDYYEYSYTMGSTTSTGYILGDLDGSDNWEIIKNYAAANGDSESAYYAFNYANTYGQSENLDGNYSDGWYIPSLAELHKIYTNTVVINKVLTAINATAGYSANTFESNQNYWSSSSAQGLISNINNSYYIQWSSGEIISGSGMNSNRNQSLQVCVVHKLSN